MNNVALGIVAGLCLLALPRYIVCPFHNVIFNDLLLMLNTTLKIYIYSLDTASKPCPYYVQDFLNTTYYVFNLTTEDKCQPYTRTLSADLGNDTQAELPYMDIKNWEGNETLRKLLKYYNDEEKCGVVWYRRNGTSHYELHVRENKFLIMNGKKVFYNCFSVYSAYISQLNSLTLECTHGC
ncbi:uncharacterized protein LOC119462752 isoform X2 [Dermacentor silvarum]|uniref:uncharacterized protein LOC119462752 isoform X2 n=1 Tax=Dermacentor silvarum TaxID=543639 RepID=UPI0021012BD3|nr:uncharacterized protein LOC119462752 isoform X2 [Dermacentor silvarum]